MLRDTIEYNRQHPTVRPQVCIVAVDHDRIAVYHKLRPRARSWQRNAGIANSPMPVSWLRSVLFWVFLSRLLPHLQLPVHLSPVLQGFILRYPALCLYPSLDHGSQVSSRRVLQFRSSTLQPCMVCVSDPSQPVINSKQGFHFR